MLQKKYPPPPLSVPTTSLSCLWYVCRFLPYPGTPSLPLGTLEHLVDTSLVMEADAGATHRLLHCTKNRFGSSSEVCVWAFPQDGTPRTAA